MTGNICILSLTPIADDPRVRRQGEAFHAAGWKVMALGLEGAKSVMPVWDVREVTVPLPPVIAPIETVPVSPPTRTRTRTRMRTRTRASEPPRVPTPPRTPARAPTPSLHSFEPPSASEAPIPLGWTFEAQLDQIITEIGCRTPARFKPIGRRIAAVLYPVLKLTARGLDRVSYSAVYIFYSIIRLFYGVVRISYGAARILARMAYSTARILARMAYNVAHVSRDGGAYIAHVSREACAYIADAVRDACAYSADVASDAAICVLRFSLRLKSYMQLIIYRLRALIMRLARRTPLLLWAMQTLALKISYRFACRLYMQHPIIHAFYEEGLKTKADIYLANDWHMLPVAIQLAEHFGTKFAYDTHEYSLEEYRYKKNWAITKRPMIFRLEDKAIKDACVVSTVSPGIAAGLRRDYKTKRVVHAIPNVPPRIDMPFNPCGERINVLYHGIIAPDRGLEECIASVPMWRPEFHFQLRGPFSSPEIEQTLKSLVQQYGVADRVHFLPKVPMTEMVREANASDVGISTPPKTSQHNIYALPNKFFEYIQAGLALAICDLPDMGAYVRQHDLGVFIEGVVPEQIAAGINRLTREKINYYKKQSLNAAQVLNWQVEQQRMLAFYEAALTEKN